MGDRVLGVRVIGRYDLRVLTRLLCSIELRAGLGIQEKSPITLSPYDPNTLISTRS
jgi:hypothetical protein